MGLKNHELTKMLALCCVETKAPTQNANQLPFKRTNYIMENYYTTELVHCNIKFNAFKKGYYAF
jgi:hypothetical protein